MKISDIKQYVTSMISIAFFVAMCLLLLYKNTAILRGIAVATFTPDVVYAQMNRNFNAYQPYFEIINDIVIADFHKRETSEVVYYNIDLRRNALLVTKDDLIYLEPYQLAALHKMNEYCQYKYSVIRVRKDRVMYSSSSIAPYIVFVKDGKKPEYFFDENSKITFFSAFKARNITKNWYMLYISAFL